MNTFDTDSILASVESYVSELPPRRRRRTAEERYDSEAETENYGGIDPAAASIRCELTHEDQVQLHLLLWRLARAQGAAATQPIIEQIRSIVGLDDALPSLEEAMSRSYADALRRAKGGAK